MKTRLVILAASAQPGGRCVAGKTMDGRRWVRPVFDAEESGGIPAGHIILTCEQATMAGDIVEMDLLGQNPKTDHQIENRLMVEGARWRRVGRIRYRDLEQYADDMSGGLWPSGESTRFGENNCVSSPARADGSLRLFRARGLSVEMIEDNPDHPGEKRPYAVFQLNGADHRIRVTDRRDRPESFLRALRLWRFRPRRSFFPECFVCASLASTFRDGRCHKLIACIIEPERLP